MLSALTLDYVAHLDRGYCYNHPDVIAQTKNQVVDRAVKQLLTALQSNGFELDGNILKRGNGWVKYDNDYWQFSNDAGATWFVLVGSTDGKLDVALIPDTVAMLTDGKLSAALMPDTVAMLTDGKLSDTMMPATVPLLVDGRLPDMIMPGEIAAIPESTLPTPVPNNAKLFVSPPTTDNWGSIFGLKVCVGVFGTTIIDQSPNAKPLTLTNVTIQDGMIRFTNSNGCISIPASSDFALGTGDFTVECRILITESEINRPIFHHRSPGVNGGWAVTLYNRSVSFDTHDAQLIVANTALSLNTIHHLAITREGDTLRLFIDGVLDRIVTSIFNNFSYETPLLIGDTNDGWTGWGQSFNGFLNNVMVVKGICRYNANFTPSTPLPQQLWCLFADGRLVQLA